MCSAKNGMYNNSNGTERKKMVIGKYFSIEVSDVLFYKK
jgi:hypothetical protein